MINIFPSPPQKRRTLQKKLFWYMLLLTALLLFVLFAGLLLVGRFHSTRTDTAEKLELQMDIFERDMDSYWEKIAAMGVDLSEDMTEIIQTYIDENSLTLSLLTDNKDALSDLQEAMFDPLCQKMYQTSCSGAFVILEATVNSSLPEADCSRSGLYLEKIRPDASQSGIVICRGMAEVAASRKIMPHSKWRLEFNTNEFSEYADHFAKASFPVYQSCRMTDLGVLPGTSEQAILITVPLLTQSGEVYGLCGFEVNQSYFKAVHAQPTNFERMICLLTTCEVGRLNADAGLSCGTVNGYYMTPTGLMVTKDLSNGLTVLSNENEQYVGLSRSITIYQPEYPLCLTVMIPKQDYDQIVLTSDIQFALLILLLLFFAAVSCFYFSKRFLLPLLKSLDQVKAGKRVEARSEFLEFDDLFAFLAEQDREHEESMTALTHEMQEAQSEKERLQSEYKKAQEKCESAQMEISRLVYSRKQEVDPMDYQRFLEGVQKLTPTESKIFGYYLSGKSTKEILNTESFKENTLRYHNKNIYEKLGVHSLKQLLRYAALMQQENGFAAEAD